MQQFDKKILKNLMFWQKLLPCTLVFNIPTKTLQPPHADLLETTQLEKGNFSRSNSQTRFKNTEKESTLGGKCQILI